MHGAASSEVSRWVGRALQVLACAIVLLLASVPPAQGQGWIWADTEPASFGDPFTPIEVEFQVNAECPFEEYFYVVVDYVLWSGQIVGYNTPWGSFSDFGWKPKFDRSYDLVAVCHCEDWWGFPSDTFEVRGGTTVSAISVISAVHYLGMNSYGRPTALPYNCSGNSVPFPWFHQGFAFWDGWWYPHASFTAEEHFISQGSAPEAGCTCDDPGFSGGSGWSDGGVLVDSHLWACQGCCEEPCGCPVWAHASWNATDDLTP